MKLIHILYLLLFSSMIIAQDQVFIYGKIHTIDNEIYTGPIRWGKEEVYWTDMFNSTKTANPYIRYLSRESAEKFKKSNNISIKTIFGDFEIKSSWNESAQKHSFECYFGDIKKIYIESDKDVEVIFKNGNNIDLKGGSNDISTKIWVIDKDLGKLEVRWNRIDKIEFLPTPSRLESRFGPPLFGTVKTDKGNFTGYIQWDHDERLLSDKLDGEYKESDISIPFQKIESIQKFGRGSNVILKSGKEIYLTGSNDVNSENRGIVVSIPNFGRVDINWEDFKKVNFTPLPKNMIKSYTEFTTTKKLKGIVETREGKIFKGTIAYDLDEAWDIEILNGKDDDIDYSIPFRNIKKISPRNYNYTDIELKNGQALLLGESQDVSDENDGILIFSSKGTTTYITWEELKQITFE